RGMLCLLGDRDERLGDRDAGFDQRRELARGCRELRGAHAPAPHVRASLLAQLRRVDAARPEHLPCGTDALGADDAAPAPPGRREGAIAEDRHQPSSCVTRSTSATVVIPARAFASPSSRNVTMPAAVAWWRMADASAR